MNENLKVSNTIDLLKFIFLICIVDIQMEYYVRHQNLFDGMLYILH